MKLTTYPFPALALVLFVAPSGADAFLNPAQQQQQRHILPVLRKTLHENGNQKMTLCRQSQQEDHGIDADNQDPGSTSTTSRRSWLLQSATCATAATTALFISPPESAFAAASDSVYKAAKRPTAYRVDSTVPPTLLSIASAREQTSRLKSIASGSGTDKEAIIVDTVNLNNILNKAVFGTARFVQSRTTAKDDSTTGLGYASYLCLGLPRQTTSVDVDLASSLLTTVLAAAAKSNNKNVAVGLHWAPLSTQSALDQYTTSSQQQSDFASLSDAMTAAGVSAETMTMYQPLLERIARTKGVNFLALSPEYADLDTVMKSGLQQVNPERRAAYVADPQGFIGMTTQPQFQLYTDRSLFKDIPTGVKEGDFFAQRILAHETAASVCAKYAEAHQTSDGPTPLVAVVAPTPDLRFLVGGINGRLARVSNFLGLNKVTNNAVTTILCNPTAADTLSKTRYLRLEIGTGPETIQYQSKVADYLWFSSSPKVNLIPRLMN